MPLQTKKSVTERKPRGKRCVVVCKPVECLEELPLKMLKEKPLRNEAGCYLNPKTNRYVKEGTANFKKLEKDKVIVLEVV